MAKKITVYEKPTCTTCRNLAMLFRENGIDYDKVNYFIEPLSADKLRNLLKKAGLKPYAVLRTKEAEFKESGITPETPDDEVVAFLVKHPSVLQRPIVEIGNKAVLARPAEKALDLIESASGSL
jgi:arsenate reductase